MTRTIAMRIEYDGGGFLGYQRQKDASIPTVQGLLEEICSEVLDEPVTVVCAGRTDAGVHAIGQVVHVKTSSDRPLEVFVRALVRNAHGRIGVRHAWEAPPWFHARHSAARRAYQYHMLVQKTPLPVLAQRAWHYNRALDFDLLREESASLLGRRDFRAFCSGGGDLNHYFRTIHRLEWRRLGDCAGDTNAETGSGVVHGAPEPGGIAHGPWEPGAVNTPREPAGVVHAPRIPAGVVHASRVPSGVVHGAPESGGFVPREPHVPPGAASGDSTRTRPSSPSYLVEGISRLPLWLLDIEADAFLPRMVRMVVATLVDVAAGRRPPGTAARVLRGLDAREASAPAPPHGLCLIRVDYPPACSAPPPSALLWGS